LISVDLPAPFSPRSATISPAPTSIPASMSACVPPKCFDTPRIARRGWPDRGETLPSRAKLPTGRGPAVSEDVMEKPAGDLGM
jgi:hypothetical protein